MSTVEIITPPVSEPWDVLSREGKRVFRCNVNIYEEDGTYCAYAADLPGIVSEGDTEEESLDGIRNAYAGVIQTFWEDDKDVPWHSPAPPRENEKRRSIEVEVAQTPEC